MAELRKHSPVTIVLKDNTTRKGKVHKIFQDGTLRINVDSGGQVTVTRDQLVEGNVPSDMVEVLGLQPDPPESISRVAHSSSATVLPSPVAPETNKSGIGKLPMN